MNLLIWASAVTFAGLLLSITFETDFMENGFSYSPGFIGRWCLALYVILSTTVVLANVRALL